MQAAIRIIVASGLALAGAACAGAATPHARAPLPEGVTAHEAAGLAVYQFASPEAAIFANAFVVDVGDGLVVVDSTLTVSTSTALAGFVESLGEPVRAILVTHAHPDHYNGLTALRRVFQAPIYSTSAVRHSIAAIDASKEAQWRPVFGDEWPATRVFPDTVATPGRELTFGAASFSVIDVGAAESHADSVWIMRTDRGRAAFVGDLAFNGAHAYLCDGHLTEWSNALESLSARATREDWLRLFPGHGAPGDAGMLVRQGSYIEAFREAVQARAADGVSEAEAAEIAADVEASQRVAGLRFLVGVCAAPVAASLGQ